MLKQASQEANTCNPDISAANFRNYWSTKLGLLRARSGADAALDRVHALLAQSKKERCPYIPHADEYLLPRTPDGAAESEASADPDDSDDFEDSDAYDSEY